MLPNVGENLTNYIYKESDNTKIGGKHFQIKNGCVKNYAMVTLIVLPSQEERSAPFHWSAPFIEKTCAK